MSRKFISRDWNVYVCVAILFLALFSFTGISTAQTWTKITESGPSAREASAMAYDTIRGVTVLFGGRRGGSETWEWDGANWTRINLQGPPYRYGHSMVYDSRRRVIVLFGGYYPDLFRALDDTWEYDGIQWREIDIEGPEARYYHSMAYDSNRGVTVLYGAYMENKTGTWEYDGASWTRKHDSGPYDGLKQHCMEFDPVSNLTILFGGYSGGDQRDGTWGWNGSTWSQLSVSGPPARQQAAMAYDSNWKKIVLFGGTQSIYLPEHFTDTWTWDGSGWNQLNIEGVRNRYGHSMAFDSQRNRIVLFGGSVGAIGYVGDTWEFDSGYIVPGADLKVENIAFGDSATGTPGETSNVTVKILNEGLLKANNFIVQLKEENKHCDEATVGGLGPGKTIDVMLNYLPLSKGTKTLTAVADPLSTVNDQDRSNNSVTVAFNVRKLKGVDLMISNVSVNFSVSASSAKTVTVGFLVANCGAKKSRSFSYQAYLTRKSNKIRSKDTLVVKTTVKSLAGGKQLSVFKSIEMKKLPKKLYLQIMVDSENEIKEANENNNKFVKKL